ncbi:MAG: hypothetical protein FWC30_00885 [Candidatus Bathyarchaeota archaeon]|nr:hypothetical protein [Candidatus Termiticorpusculum sp.]
MQESHVTPEPIVLSRRQNVPELMRDLRVEVNEEKRRNRANARIKAIKPKQMFVITPSEPKQRKIEVGKFAKNDE